MKLPVEIKHQHKWNCFTIPFSDKTYSQISFQKLLGDVRSLRFNNGKFFLGIMESVMSPYSDRKIIWRIVSKMKALEYYEKFLKAEKMEKFK